MRKTIIHPELLFIRCLWIWNYWAFGRRSHTQRRAKPYEIMRAEIVTFSFGPLRVQFLDWSKRWSK